MVCVHCAVSFLLHYLKFLLCFPNSLAVQTINNIDLHKKAHMYQPWIHECCSRKSIILQTNWQKEINAYQKYEGTEDAARDDVEQRSCLSMRMETMVAVEEIRRRIDGWRWNRVAYGSGCRGVRRRFRWENEGVYGAWRYMERGEFRRRSRGNRLLEVREQWGDWWWEGLGETEWR